LNFLEQLTAEWFSLQGYFVRTNMKFGKRPEGGWDGEMDVIAFKALSRKLIHIETSMDAYRWEKRIITLTRKFDEADKHYKELFSFKINSISRIAVVGFSQTEHRIIRNDIELKTCPQFIKEIGSDLINRHPLKQVIPETLPLLRAMQFAVHWGPQSQIFRERYLILART
jgi:hypothetical protein